MTATARRSPPSPRSRAAPRAVFYPETDRMGEHELQRFIAELLRPLLARWLGARGVVAHAGADTFMYWVEGDPTQRVAPDVYVLPGIAQDVAVPSWKLWEIGVAPSFALEVVTGDPTKDYDDVPALYAELGAKELVIFDPGARITHARRVRWQVYRRLRGRGLVRVEVSQADSVRSKTLGAYLRVVGQGALQRVRLAETEQGPLFPTEAEHQAAQAQEQAARAQSLEAQAQEQAARAQDLEARTQDLEALAREQAARAQNLEVRAQDLEARAQAAEREIARLRGEIARRRG